MKILTFDIEDWFHILDNESTESVHSWCKFESRLDSGVERILKLLDENQVRATFFCLGWVAERYPHVLKKIVACGHEVGSHSYAHQLAYNQSRKDFEKDLRRSVFAIEDVISEKVVAYRAPGFSITNNNVWAFESLIDCGIEFDSSVFPAPRGHGGIKDFGYNVPHKISCQGSILKELPINTTRIFGKQFVFSGGGYFRLLPKWYLNSKFSNEKYVMTYFHPRDFDVGQPIVPGLSPIRRFKSYVGIGRAISKLDSIIRRNEFVSMGKAVEQIDWMEAPIVTI